MNALETIQELERLQKENETLQNELLKQKQKLSDIRINTDRINPVMYELQDKQFEKRILFIERLKIKWASVAVGLWLGLMAFIFLVYQFTN